MTSFPRLLSCFRSAEPERGRFIRHGDSRLQSQPDADRVDLSAHAPANLGLLEEENVLRLIADGLPAFDRRSLRGTSKGWQDLIEPRRLRLSHPEKIIEAVEKLPGLEAVDISLRADPMPPCHDFDISAIINAVSRLPKLRELRLASLSGIGASHLRALRGLPLRTLELRNCYSVNDDALYELRDMPLEELDLRGCERFTSKGVAVLRTMNLRSLAVSCFALRSDAFAELSRLNLSDLRLQRSRWISLKDCIGDMQLDKLVLEDEYCSPGHAAHVLWVLPKCASARTVEPDSIRDHRWSKTWFLHDSAIRVDDQIVSDKSYLSFQLSVGE